MKTEYLLALVLAGAVCHAQAVYTYTGHNFTFVSGSVSTSDHVGVSLTLASALPANDNTTIFSATSWTISDGVGTLSSSDGSSTIIAELTTDSSGKITNWDISGFGTGVITVTCVVSFQCNSDTTQRVDVNGNFIGTGSVLTNPGTWTSSVVLPLSPSGLTATAGNTQVTLNWAAVTGATGYNVKRATVNGGPYTLIAGGTTATSYTDVGLANGTTYYYVVSTVSASGEGPNSAQVSARPIAPPLVITTTNIANGIVGTAYTQALVANGGVPPYGWSVVSSGLPGGLSLVTGTIANQCTITGTPTAVGSFSFSIQVSDHAGSTATQVYSIVVSQLVPSIVSGGVLNAASFAKNSNGQGSPVAPGSLVAIFTSPLATSAATFSTTTLPGSLSAVSVTFNGILAPMVAVSPTGQYPYVSAQVPFEVLSAGQTSAIVGAVITVNNVPSAAVSTSIIASAPGIYTIPATGQGNAILTFLNPATNQPAIAAPPSAGIAYPTAPIPRGTGGFFYVNGLGAMTPSVLDGSGSCPAADGICNANAMPTVLVGGITAPVAFAGQAPGFPGVYQINITIPQNAPTGNAVQLIVKSSDGTVTSNIATIAVQ